MQECFAGCNEGLAEVVAVMAQTGEVLCPREGAAETNVEGHLEGTGNAVQAGQTLLYVAPCSVSVICVACEEDPPVVGIYVGEAALPVHIVGLERKWPKSKLSIFARNHDDYCHFPISSISKYCSYSIIFDKVMGFKPFGTTKIYLNSFRVKILQVFMNHKHSDIIYENSNEHQP